MEGTKTKTRTFYYRRAKWKKQSKITLEKILIDAHTTLDTVGKRTFSRNIEGKIKGASFLDQQGLYLQIVSYVPGEATPIVDADENAEHSNVTQYDAPKGKDYLNGEIFAYIRGNHVILCPSGVRENIADIYILHILKTLGHDDIASSFELDRVARTDKLQMIKKEGVKEIDLSVSLYEASLIYMDKQKSKSLSLKEKMLSEVSSIFSQDTNPNDIKEKENLNVRIALRYDGAEARKHSKDPEFGKAGKDRLEKTAEAMISELDSNDDSGFSIITGANNKITSDQIRISETFRIESFGRSISKLPTWSNLKQYYDRLETEGVIKQ